MSAPACPICRRPATAHYQPFCCKRCADVDLQRWFTGAYAVPGEELGEEGAGPDGEGAGRPRGDPL